MIELFKELLLQITGTVLFISGLAFDHWQTSIIGIFFVIIAMNFELKNLNQ